MIEFHSEVLVEQSEKSELKGCTRFFMCHNHNENVIKLAGRQKPNEYVMLLPAMNAYNALYEDAVENYGLVTTELAKRRGISGMSLVMLERRVRRRLGRGVTIVNANTTSILLRGIPLNSGRWIYRQNPYIVQELIYDRRK